MINVQGGKGGKGGVKANLRNKGGRKTHAVSGRSTSKEVDANPNQGREMR
jgi:hypothetical protein